MRSKKIFALICSAMLALSFTACGGEKKCAHVDKNDDGKCDVCSTDYSDGVDEQPVSTVDCTFNVKTDNGLTASNVAFTLTSAKNEYSLVSNENGVISANIAFGKYDISYDYDTLPEYCTPDVFSIEIDEETTAVTLLLINNMPDGSANKPFFVSDDVTELSLEAGAEVYYVYRGAEIKTLIIENENLAVIYNDDTYSPESGIISVPLQTQIGGMVKFCIKNTSSAVVETEFTLLSPLGSMSNPIVMEQASATANIPENGGVYYQWTATKNGVLVVSSENSKNNISLINMNTNAVSAQTLGSAGEYLSVSANDVVLIAVSAINAEGAVDVAFAINVYEGTTSDPIPVIKDEIDISLKANASLVFSTTAGKTLVIENESDIVVNYNTTDYEPVNNEISVTLTGETGTPVVFTVSNTADTLNNVSILFE
ncbi:MAG: hypothetical protein IJZ32_01925 [Clostridia bacterium]|nr:hypothetical protein [Clostridia bacterium]